MKKFIIFILVVLIFPSSLLSQGFQYEWAIGIGGLANESGQSIAVDAEGSVYATGKFVGTVDFDPGPGVFYLNTNGSEDVYVSKFDSSGNFVWAKSFVSPGNNDNWCNSICLDHDGNLLMTGHFSDTVDFDPSPLVYTLFPTGYSDIFICKLNNSGDLIWAKNFGSAGSNAGSSIIVDDFGAIYAVGFFTDSVDFDSGAGVFNLISNGSTDIFISKFSPSGNLVWAKSVGGISNDGITACALDGNGNIHITGTYKGTVDFNPGPGVFNLQYLEYFPDIFISKLDSSGNFIWAKSIAGYDDFNSSWNGNVPYSIAVDDAGNVYTTGAFQYIVDFDPGPGVYYLTSNGGHDVFISKLNANGEFVWAKAMGYDLSAPSFSDIGTSLTVDNAGNIFTTGCFWETVDFDPGPSVFPLSSNGGREIFLLKLDSAGNFVRAISLGGSGESDVSLCIVNDASGNIYTTGFFSGVVDFNPGIGQSILSSNGYDDAFILKLGHCLSTYYIIEQSACVEYNFNGNMLTNSGSYQDTLLSFLGCDSIVALDLTIIPVDISVVQNGNTLTAGTNGAIYQWIDCTNGNTIIPGATNQSFTTTINGSYAVIVSENGCTDTSMCYTISNIGIDKNNQDIGFTISPNPAKNRLVVHSSVNLMSIEIFASTGQLLQKQKSSKGNKQINISSLPPGNYFIRAISQEEVFVKKFVVVR